MANILYNTAKKEILDGTVKLYSDIIQIFPVTSTYVPNADDDLVDAGGASDPLDAEIVATGYTGGYAGSGRKTLSNLAFTVDDTNDKAVCDNTVDITWSTLGNGTNATIAGFVIIKKGAADDTTARLIAYLDTADTTTTGSDFTLQFNASGIFTW